MKSSPHYLYLIIYFILKKGFVIGLIRNPNGTSINNAFVTKLKDECDNLKLNLKEFNKITLKVFAQNNVYFQDVKQKIETKAQEAHIQLKLVQESLVEELISLKNNCEKSLNETKLFEIEINDRVKLWTKQLNSGEFKSDSEKLNRIYVEIDTYMRALEEKKNIVSSYVHFQEICYFEEKFFKFDKKFLGQIRKTIDISNMKLVRFKLLIGSKMLLKSVCHLSKSLGFLLIGMWYLISGLLLLLISSFKKTKINLSLNEDIYMSRLKYVFSFFVNCWRFLLPAAASTAKVVAAVAAAESQLLALENCREQQQHFDESNNATTIQECQEQPDEHVTEEGREEEDQDDELVITEEETQIYNYAYNYHEE